MAKSFNILILTLIGVASLLLAGVLSPDAAQAWELVTGRVESMTEVNGNIHLTVLTDSNSEETQTSANPKPLNQTIINFEVPPEDLPKRLKEGDLIRIWQHSDKQLKPVRISYSRGYDPTGVRSRLSGRGQLSSRGGGGGKGGHGGH